MGKGRDNFQKNKEKHREFRTYYTDKQIRRFHNIALICALYSLVAMAFLGPWMVKDLKYSFWGYGSLLAISVLAMLLNRLGERVIRFKDSEKRYFYFEFLCILFTLLYILWGYFVMGISVIEGRTTNFMPIFIVYSVCTFFLYMSSYHYVMFYVMCSILAIVEMHLLKQTSLDYSQLLNTIILGAVLTGGGILKYRAGSEAFFAVRKSMKLQEEVTTYAEEVMASNDELLEMTDKLRDANKQQKLFTASLNHELRSPLNGILGLLQVLIDEPDLKEEHREFVTRAFDSSKTLLQIVNDMLDFAKLEAGEFTIVCEPFNLKTVVDDVDGIMRPLAKAKNLNLEIRASEDMPCKLNGDSIRIKQIMTNLISNGIKYSEKGFVRMELEVRDSLLTIRVVDSGQGIPADAMEDLFVPFKRVNEQKNRNIQGTGLGLPIVASLIHQMRGEIKVDSVVDSGSVFTVVLPVQLEENQVYYGGASKNNTAELEIPDFSGKQFLCVDDNNVNLAVFAGLLKGTNAQIDKVPRAKAGLDLASKYKYDIIFMDHQMPEMDGEEALQVLKGMDGPNKDTPVIVMTANAGLEAEQHYCEVGFDAYVSKPILKPILLETIQAMLTRKN